MGDLHFIETPHSYVHDGKPIAGLTSVMTAEGYIKGDWYTKEGRERGTAVHLGCEDYDRGGCDWQRLSTEQIPYIEAWIQFCEDYGFKPLQIEQPVHSHIHQFATTPDVVGSDKSHEIVLIDRKSGASEGWHPIQTAAQAIAYSEESGISVGKIIRLSVILKPTGKYKAIPHDNWKDFDVAKAMLLIHHDKHNRGIPCKPN